MKNQGTSDYLLTLEMQSEVRGETEESPTILSYGKGFLILIIKVYIHNFHSENNENLELICNNPPQKVCYLYSP